MRAEDRTGLLGEEIAADHLAEAGHLILERRWRSTRGELDLVTIDGDELVAVEVKTRRGLGYGHPFEAVGPQKLHRLHRLLAEYVSGYPGPRIRRRVDVVSVLLPPDDARAAEDGVRPRVEHLRDVRP